MAAARASAPATRTQPDPSLDSALDPLPPAPPAASPATARPSIASRSVTRSTRRLAAVADSEAPNRRLSRTDFTTSPTLPGVAVKAKPATNAVTLGPAGSPRSSTRV